MKSGQPEIIKEVRMVRKETCNWGIIYLTTIFIVGMGFALDAMIRTRGLFQFILGLVLIMLSSAWALSSGEGVKK